jgi:hypothetical protein
MRLPHLSPLRAKWKTVLSLIALASASFSIGALANQVVVQQVQSLAGNHVLVPAPELQILSSSWSIDGVNSVVVGVVLNVTTVGASGLTGSKLYQIFVQVSCLNAAGMEYTCATGSNTITLPVNMNGASTILIVRTTPPIDPETTQIHDLSFIVTGSPSPVTTPQCPPGTLPDFTITASPATVNLTATNPTALVIKTLTSVCGFTGTVNLSVTQPPGITDTINPPAVTLTAGGTATVVDKLNLAPQTPRGTFPVTVTAVSGTITHTVTITVNVA